VIIGFGLREVQNKRIFDYPDVRSDPVEVSAKNINPYLLDAPSVLIRTQHDPISDVPQMSFGNMPADGGKLLFSEAEARDFLALEPGAAPFMLPLLSAKEFLNGKTRYCLWLHHVEPKLLRSLPLIYDRVRQVREIREVSSRPHLADVPHLFAQITQTPTMPILLIPCHSSESRRYIPMGLFDKGCVSHNSCVVVKNAARYHFGILTSRMHMAWVQVVCGRLESRYRYSKDIVYNNFPWPENVTDTQRAQIESLAQGVLDARALYPDSSLADLYDPLAMPKELVDAHHALDRAVDRLYQRKAFASDAERVALLFKRYRALTA
jgi:hypothetical protein